MWTLIMLRVGKLKGFVPLPKLKFKAAKLNFSTNISLDHT